MLNTFEADSAFLRLNIYMFPSYFNIFVSFVAFCSKNKSSKRPFVVRQKRTFSQTINGHKNSKKKASSHTDVSRALISAADRVPAKYDFAGKETAAPIGALLMTESTQRSFGAVFLWQLDCWFG
jgi:hypothetical protein